MSVRSLAAADSGISTMQTELDTIGNNIANSSTTGYKQTEVEFQDILTEQLTPAGAASPGLASTNPTSIGAGAQVAGMQTNFSAGNPTQTGVSSNAAIQGNGFFVVRQGNQIYYTRDGAFQPDINGTLSTANGGIVEGWPAGAPTTGPTGPITIPSNLTQAPHSSTTVTLTGNLPSGATGAFTTTTTVYDAQGNATTLDLTFTPTTANTWTVQASAGGVNLGAADTLSFGANGQVSGAPGPFTVPLPAGFQPAPGQTGISLAIPAAGAASPLTQYSTSQTVSAATDGYPSGNLQSWSIGKNGVITGTFSNGESQGLGTIALATFSNPGGLSDLGNLNYQASASSGQPQVGTPGAGTAGTLLGGAVEQSNVDLAGQLTQLVDAQTNYEADTKVIATTQTVLQALVTNA